MNSSPSLSQLQMENDILKKIVEQHATYIEHLLQQMDELEQKTEKTFLYMGEIITQMQKQQNNTPILFPIPQNHRKVDTSSDYLKEELM